MSWKTWKDDPAVQKLIIAGRGKDPATLALQWSGRKDIPVHWILQQITGRRTASKKIPAWAANDAVIFPPKITLEQCSSALTSQYKAETFRPYKRVTDLTGGLGVDSFAFAEHAGEVLYIEPVEERLELAQHNHKVLGRNNISYLLSTAEASIEAVKAFKPDLVYIDPSRRDDEHNRVFRLADLTPDPLTIIRQLSDESVRILLKAAPMLDIMQALRDLEHTAEVHVVSMRNECRELLFLMDNAANDDPRIICTELHVNDSSTFSFHLSHERSLPVVTAEISNYLYDPYASVTKAGGFRSVAEQFNVHPLHPNTHIYTGRELKNDFPGRKFKVDDVMSYDIGNLKKLMKNKQAHLLFRNFPGDAAEITRRLNIRSGGSQYLFFVTQKDNRPVVISATLSGS